MITYCDKVRFEKVLDESVWINPDAIEQIKRISFVGRFVIFFSNSPRLYLAETATRDDVFSFINDIKASNICKAETDTVYMEGE